MNYTDGYILKK